MMMSNMFFAAEDFENASRIFELFDCVANETRICLLCTLIDVAASDCGKSSAELLAMIQTLVTDVNDELGAFQRTG